MHMERREDWMEGDFQRERNHGVSHEAIHGEDARQGHQQTVKPNSNPLRFSTSALHTFQSRTVLMAGICGLTNVEDGRVALSCGADFLGMIMWPKAKRHVSTRTAKAMMDMSRSFRIDADAFPRVVGVFVDESVDAIEDVVSRTKIDVVQLHGTKSRAALEHLSTNIPVIYVLHADHEGRLVDADMVLKRPVDWILVDGLKGGSGERIPLNKLTLPDWIHDPEMVHQGWLLAGGLSPTNVSDALSSVRSRGLHPIGVDVSSGVCAEDGLRKHPSKIQDFIRSVRR